MQYNKLFTITILLLLFSGICNAQKPTTGILKGKVIDISKGQPIPFANIFIKTLSIGCTTDENGNYVLKNISPETHQVTASSLGYTTRTKKVTIRNNSNKAANFSLEEQANSLDEVVVAAKSKTTRVKEQPFAVSSIDVAPLKMLNLDINQILNASTGVRIRESGGLGSDFNFSLNGFSGNQIKFFIDGIPMDNFGSSLTLNNIPSNQISRIEVYKGVIPIQLGADALGGAVNVVTNTTSKSFVDVSYAFGSFNTHRVSLLGKHFNEKSGFTFNTNAFFNYSDNNYKIDVEIPEEGTGIINGFTEVERFHDSYQSQTIQAEAGFVNKKYADKFLVGVIASSNNKDEQFGFNQSTPFGEVFSTSKVIVGTLKYQKKDLFTKNLKTNIYATYSVNESLKDDTSSRVYDWHGDYTINNSLTEGEYEDDKTQFTYTDKSTNIGASFGYEINKNHSFSFNNTFNRLTRVGSDPYDLDGIIAFSEPHSLSKNIVGLSYSLNLLDNKWKTNVFGKYFLMNAEAYDEEWNGEDGVSYLVKITSDFNFSGYGIASTYFITKDIQVKSSYESTYRLPNGDEMFGDGLTVLANPNLKPEKSENFNIGFLAKKKFAKHNVLVELGYLYRETEDLIRSRILWLMYSQSVNLFKAKNNSFEAGIKYNYNDKLHIEINGTYQNLINTNELTSNGTINNLYLDRLPNIPYLFGNASLSYRFEDFIKKENHLALNYSTHFVETFYLNWPSQGDINTKYDIPQQISHDIALSYAIKDGKYNISLAGTNIANKILYDNYKLQKPGRAFSLKLNYFLQ